MHGASQPVEIEHLRLEFEVAIGQGTICQGEPKFPQWFVRHLGVKHPPPFPPGGVALKEWANIPW